MKEEVVDPQQRIVDPHHHLWPIGGAMPYGLADLHGRHRRRATTSCDTVFVECRAAYRTDGPAHLQPVGETEFVAGEARAATRGSYRRHRRPRRPHATPRTSTRCSTHTEAAAGPVPRHPPCRVARIEPEVLMIPVARRRASTPTRRSVPACAGWASAASPTTRGTTTTRTATSPNSPAPCPTPDRARPLRHAARRRASTPVSARRSSTQWKADIADDRRVPERGRQVRWAGDARQRLRLAHGRAAAHVGRVRRRAAPLLPAHHRVLRPRAVHVRVELPGRPLLAVVHGAVERPEEDRRAVLGRRARRDVLHHRGAHVPPGPRAPRGTN